MEGLRLAKVIQIYPETNTIDVFFINTGGIAKGVPVTSISASTSGGIFELPKLNTVSDIRRNRTTVSNNQLVPTENLYEFENQTIGRIDLDDPASNYAYAIIAMVDKQLGKIQPICLGFLTPITNQILFNTTNIPLNADSVTKQELPKFKGAYLHRTNSDVYEYIDSDGNMEYSHPNGSFVRLAETPTESTDGTYHVNLNGANASAETQQNGTYTGDRLTTSWDTSLATGVDGKKNSDRKLYFHMEVVTGVGVVSVHVDRDTGNVAVATPAQISLSAMGGANTITLGTEGAVVISSPNTIATGNFQVGSGASGVFTSQDGKTITVKDGIITSII